MDKKEGFLFSKEQRILKSSDYESLKKTGKKTHLKNFIVVYSENGLGFHRLGLTVSKKVGGAVQRNKIKRRLREYFRLNQKEFSFRSPVDINIIARSSSTQIAFGDLKEELNKFFKKQ